MNINDYIEQHKLTEQSTEEARQSLLGKASMFFFNKDSGEVQAVYEDEACEIELCNPIQADKAGNFPVFHFSKESSYSIEVQDTRGKSVLKAALVQDAPQVQEDEAE